MEAARVRGCRIALSFYQQGVWIDLAARIVKMTALFLTLPRTFPCCDAH